MATALTLTLAAACGSSAPGAVGSGGTPRSTGSASLTPGAPSTTPSTPSGSGVFPQGPTASTSPAPLGSSAGGRVSLARTCAHRGDPREQQTVTVRAGPGETVTYATYYSDMSSQMNRPDYTTGQGHGEAGSDGKFRASWVVPAGATPGRATVRVTATDMTEDAQEASFLVVKQTERCP